MDKPHLSSSQIGMFLRCPRQWAFRYVEGIKSPPSGAMKLGGTFHQTVERNYRQKIESRTDLPLDEQTDYFAETFDLEFQREEVILDPGDTPGKLKDQGVDLTKAHHLKLAPGVQPVTVEEMVRLQLGKGDFAYDLMVKMDLIDEDGFIRDNKTAARPPNQADLDRDIQLSTYALGYRIQHQKAEAGLKHDVVVKTKVPQTLTMETHRNREGLKLHLNTIGHIARAIKAEAFPANPTGWWCHPRFCGYAYRCVWGSMPKTVDYGEHLQERLEDSIAQIRTEKANLEALSERPVDGGSSERSQSVTGRSRVAPEGAPTAEQESGDETRRPQRSLQNKTRP